MPDQALRLALQRVRRRARLRSALHAVAAGGSVCAVTLILLALSSPVTDRMAASIALGAGAVMTAWMIQRAWQVSLTGAARMVESVVPCENLVVTAAEIEERPRPVRAELRDEIVRRADERLQGVDLARVQPIAQPFAVAAAVLVGCGLLIGSAGRQSLARVADAGAPAGARTAAGGISVRVTPPEYTRRPVEQFENPIQVTVLAGSQVRIASGARVWREWRATESASLDIRIADDVPSRFLSLIVVPDAPPSVRIQSPGRDTAFAEPRGSLAIGIESRDDLGLASLALRYTQASGGGENVSFTEGSVPLAIERVGDRHWTARAQWPLDGLGLADGDVLVYRAVARDANPAGEPVQSDAYLVEIGRTAEIASAGFALPAEERKYAISQQMVIYKTEQLIANRAKNAGSWLEETRGIGVEQRMVRAEVVFLSGGEVEDEVEEAAHSNELAEGRLQNQGRAEMVRALGFMSRAEAQLNDGNADAALVFERQALASLERALDRRRYFLRTLPDRSRIDASRRLSGERREARSWSHSQRAAASPAQLERWRDVMRELTAAAAAGTGGATLAAAVAAIDQDSTALQQAAVAIAAASTPGERRAAAENARRAVITHALAALPASEAVDLGADPLAGRLSDALTRTPR